MQARRSGESAIAVEALMHNAGKDGPLLLAKDDGHGIGAGFRYGELQGHERSTVWCLYGVYQAAVAQTSGRLAVAVRQDIPGPGLRFGDAR